MLTLRKTLGTIFVEKKGFNANKAAFTLQVLMHKSDLLTISDFLAGLPLVLIPNFVSHWLTQKESTLILGEKQKKIGNRIYWSHNEESDFLYFDSLQYPMKTSSFRAQNFLARPEKMSIY